MTRVNIQRIATAKHAVIDAIASLDQFIDIDDSNLHIVGSTYIKDKQTSDVDVLVGVPIDPNCVTFSGWEYGGSVGIGNSNWGSWKRTVDGVEVNMLLCDSHEYIDRWLTAADVCRMLHLSGANLRAGQVHGIHEVIMEDADPELIAVVYNYR